MTVKDAALRIRRIEAFEFHRALDGAAWNPVGRWHERRAPLLRVVAEDGTAGLGEGWCDQSAIGAFFARLGAVAGGLIGRDCDAIAAIQAELSAVESRPDWAAPAVASAMDMALWDLRARRAGQPLHVALGAADGRVPVYASGGLYGSGKDRAALAGEMVGYASRGFSAVKMKVGGLTQADDLARVAAVRGALGPGTAIMVDAVGQLTRQTAPAWVDALAGLGVTAIQAPLARDDVEGMAALQARRKLDVMAEERAHRPAEFKALLGRRAVGLLQFNPGLAGGFTGGLALVAMAADAGVPVTLQCHATAVLQAACFHLGAGRADVQSVEHHQFHDHLADAMPPAMTAVRDGCLRLDDRPGLGIDPDLPERRRRGPGSIRRVLSLPG